MLIERLRVQNFRSFGKAQTFRPHAQLSMLVGPNESGKTSLLEAIKVLGRGISPAHVREGTEDLSESYVSIRLRAEDSDAAAFADAGVKCESVEITYLACEAPDEWNIRPSPAQRDFSEIEELFDEAVSSVGAHGPTLEVSRGAVEAAWVKPSIETRRQAKQMLDRVKISSEPLDVLSATLEVLSPFEQANAAIEERLPQVHSFDALHRDMKSSYFLKPQPKAAQAENRVPLKNLLEVAQLDIESLPADSGQRAERERSANNRIVDRFSALWGSERPHPNIRVEGGRINIWARDPKNPETGSLELERRSQGLRRMFEIIAFAAAKSAQSENRIVLLADEIEQHLHYDAQIDLVKWLETGGLNAQVIGTTHSLGCWPSDAGGQMNALQRVDTSTQIWQGPYTNEPGSKGIMSAVGASRAAFSFHRPVIFCEGRHDEMLLPGLFREAVPDMQDVWFVGSLSQSKKSAPPAYPALPAEAFLVDADSGGDDLKKRLTESDPTRAERVYRLDAGPANPVTLEDLLRIESVAKVVNEQWPFDTDAPPLLDPTKPIVEQLRTAVGEAAETKGSDELGSLKAAIAQDALERQRKGESALRPDLHQHMKLLFADLTSAFPDSDDPRQPLHEH